MPDRETIVGAISDTHCLLRPETRFCRPHFYHRVSGRQLRPEMVEVEV